MKKYKRYFFILFILFIPFTFMPLHIDDMLLWIGTEYFNKFDFISALRSQFCFMGYDNFTVYNFTHPLFYIYIFKFLTKWFGYPGVHPIFFHLLFILIFLFSLYNFYKAYKLNSFSLFLFLVPPIFILTTMTSIDILSLSMMLIGLSYLKRSRYWIASFFFSLSWFASYQAFWIFFPLFFTLKAKDFYKVFSLSFLTLSLWMIWSYKTMGISHPFVSLMWPGIKHSERFAGRINIIKSYIAFWGLLLGIPYSPFLFNKKRYYLLFLLLVPFIILKKLFPIAIVFFIVFIYLWYKYANKFEKLWFISYSAIILAVFPVMAIRYMLFVIIPAILPFIRNISLHKFNKYAILTTLLVSYVLAGENFIEAYNYAYLSSKIKKGENFSAEWGTRYYAEKHGAHYVLDKEKNNINEIYVFKQNPHIDLFDISWTIDTVYDFHYSPFIPIRLIDSHRNAGMHSSYSGILPFTIYRGVSEQLVKLKRRKNIAVSRDTTIVMSFFKGFMPMYFAHAPKEESFRIKHKGKIYLYAGIYDIAYGTDGVEFIIKIDSIADSFHLNRGDLIKKSFSLDSSWHNITIKILPGKTNDMDWVGWKLVGENEKN